MKFDSIQQQAAEHGIQVLEIVRFFLEWDSLDHLLVLILKLLQASRQPVVLSLPAALRLDRDADQAEVPTSNPKHKQGHHQVEPLPDLGGETKTDQEGQHDKDNDN